MHKNNRIRPGRHCAVALVAASLALTASGCSKRSVDVTKPAKGLIEESFSEPGRTRLSETYLITMPVAGRIARIDFEPGDRVSSGDALLSYDLVPFQEAVAEAREAVAQIEASIAVKSDNNIEETLLIEAQAWIDASAELLKAADEEVAAEKARNDRSSKELARMEELAAQNAISQSQLDDTRLDADTALIALKKQMFTRAAVNIMTAVVELGPRAVNQWIDRKGLEKNELLHQLAQAQSRLRRAEHELSLTSVVSPIDGVVLERYEQGDGTLPAGARLIAVGNLSDLEVEVDVLTLDALRLAVGSPVILSAAADAAAAKGSVKKIEPAGFTKLSSLGVEQQRVKVVVSLDSKSDSLGVGYSIETRFITGSRDNALKVPRSSVLEAPDRTFYVLKVVDGRLARTPVTVGLKSDLELEITSGLSDADTIVARPDATMEDGAAVSTKP